MGEGRTVENGVTPVYVSRFLFSLPTFVLAVYAPLLARRLGTGHLQGVW